MRLEPLQQVGVSFLAHAERALLGDGCGSGKTVTTMCTVEALDTLGKEPFPALIVCTKTMVMQWEDEIRRWAPHRSVAAVRGSKAKRDALILSGADYTIINWEALAAHAKLGKFGNTTSTDKDKLPKELDAVKFKTVIADEAHRGKNPQAKQTRAWWNLSWNANFSFALTGTPVAKTPEDLWSIMHGVCPKEWPSKTAFVDRYCHADWSPFGGRKITGLKGGTQEELFKFLDPRFIRRPTNVVIPNIATKLTPQVRKVEMSATQQKAYKQMRDEMITIIDDDSYVLADDTLSQMTRLLQLASAKIELAEDGSVVMADPSCKIDAMMDVLDELDDDPLVVFAQHRQLIELAAKRLDKNDIPYGIITGSVPELERAEYVRKFQSGSLPVMLATVGAGGEGITLTKARHVLFLQRTASLIQNRQAEDRVWRRGQDRPVQPIYLVTAGTIDERMIQIGEERDVTFEEIVRDKETLRRMLTDG